MKKRGGVRRGASGGWVEREGREGEMEELNIFTLLFLFMR